MSFCTICRIVSFRPRLLYCILHIISLCCRVALATGAYALWMHSRKCGWAVQRPARIPRVTHRETSELPMVNGVYRLVKVPCYREACNGDKRERNIQMKFVNRMRGGRRCAFIQYAKCTVEITSRYDIGIVVSLFE